MVFYSLIPKETVPHRALAQIEELKKELVTRDIIMLGGSVGSARESAWLLDLTKACKYSFSLCIYNIYILSAYCPPYIMS